ncbi:GNAT family N-acetyltransferase [[Empedobacter] haloabium]|uniref:GNAT family N-acetyltransferase n=1 Tax=[Empedobacter] haloabium TaxID=592317 RepID=A0ABZ1UTE1_9BURK
MPPARFTIELLPRLERQQLVHCDFSFDVEAVAVPPFDGDDIAAVVPVAPYRKDYGDADELAPDADGALFVARPTVSTAADTTSPLLGYVLVSRDWTGFALIDDLAVDRSQRGLGIGQALMDAARDWARAAGLAGLRLETQSTNVAACRFYARLGMRLGGADRLLYAGFPDLAHETALFWYLRFGDKA